MRTFEDGGKEVLVVYEFVTELCSEEHSCDQETPNAYEKVYIVHRYLM